MERGSMVALRGGAVTMKILVGLDFEDAPEAGPVTPAVIRLLNRLQFPKVSVEVAHAIDSRRSPADNLEALLFAAGEDLPRAQATERVASRYLVEGAASKMDDWIPGTPSPCGTILTGNAAVALMDRADLTHADLIAVNGARRFTRMDALLTGSVARDIVVGAHQSVLIARDRAHEAGGSEDTPTTPVRAVLATDHSPYANRCVELLGRLAPAGIGHLTVLSAYPDYQIQAFRSVVGEMAVDPAEAIRDHLCERNTTVIDLLSHHLAPGTAFTSQVTPEPVQTAIAHAMAAAEADLLILGAKGHGFAERLLLGSVSFRHAVVHAPYSVLILRA